jgi:hypothetical protein
LQGGAIYRDTLGLQAPPSVPSISNFTPPRPFNPEMGDTLGARMGDSSKPSVNNPLKTINNVRSVRVGGESGIRALDREANPTPPGNNLAQN